MVHPANTSIISPAKTGRIRGGAMWKPSLQVGLDKRGAGMNIDLAQNRVAGVNEAMWGIYRYHHNGARFHFTRFIADGDPGRAINDERDLNVWMHVQGRSLSGFGGNNVGRERCALSVADEL